MHIPDGFLNLPTSTGSIAASLAALQYAARRVRQQLEQRQVPLLGIMAAFVFSAQMVNFPVAGGTSGHLVGAALLTILLGPSTACLIMTAILIIQSLVFMDGGILALGANVLNMAVIAPFSAWAIYRLFYSLPGTASKAAGAFAASWVSVVLAAVGCSLELALSGLPLKPVAYAMLFWHSLIGLGEGALTTAILLYIWKANPSWAKEVKTV